MCLFTLSSSGAFKWGAVSDEGLLERIREMKKYIKKSFTQIFNAFTKWVTLF